MDMGAAPAIQQQSEGRSLPNTHEDRRQVMAEILDEWPTKQNEPPSPLLKYMDGKIYKFTADDAESLGYIITGTTSTWARENGLYALRNDLMAVARTEYGPWQAKTMGVDDEVATIFQFTGPRDCRATDCAVIAKEDCNGFCKDHHLKRK